MGKVEGLIWLLRVLAMLQVKPWNSKGALGTYKHVFTHINPADEFSFKETMTWGQLKISSGWLCVLCESKEIKRIRRRDGCKNSQHQWWGVSL